MLKRSLTQEGMDKEQKMSYVLNEPLNELFDYKEPDYELPVKARLFNSIACEQCREFASEHKIRLHDGKKICLDCFNEYSRGW